MPEAPVEFVCEKEHFWPAVPSAGPEGTQPPLNCPTCGGEARATRFRCPSCEKASRSEKAKPVRAGKSFRCPSCGHAHTVAAPPAGTGVPDTVKPGRATEPGGGAGGGFSLPGFRVLERLGEGAVGEVYKARQERPARVVALKVLRAEARVGPQEREAFFREAEFVGRLKHPNIMQVHGVGEYGGRPYLVLEYVEGRTLADELAGAPQPPRAAAQLVATLARAMAVAHHCGIVHRDLKPANIMLAAPPPDGLASEEGRRYGVPKIGDFGLARWMGAADGGDEGQIVGTPLYMAPEQAQGLTDQTRFSADVFALGAILYELLTGRPPFQSDSLIGVLARLVTSDPTPPSALRRGLHANLEAVCMKCLRRQAHERYRTAEELADDLERYLRLEPVKARQPYPWEAAWWWALRNPAFATLLLTVAVTVPFGLWYLGGLAEDIVVQTALRGARQEARVVRTANDLYSDESARKADLLHAEYRAWGEKHAAKLDGIARAARRAGEELKKAGEGASAEAARQKAEKELGGAAADAEGGKKAFRKAAEELVARTTHRRPRGKNAIPFPATFTIELCGKINTQFEKRRDMQFHLFSGYPFDHRPEHERGPLDELQWLAWDRASGEAPPARQALARVRPLEGRWLARLDAGEGAARLSEGEGLAWVDLEDEERPVLHYYEPWVLKPHCAECHNKQLMTTIDARAKKPRARKWEAGDLRGLLEVKYPLYEDLKSTRGALYRAYATLAAVMAAAAACCGAALWLGRRWSA